MNFDSKTFGAILIFLPALGGGETWFYSTAKNTGKMEAKVELNYEKDSIVKLFYEKHEKILDDNLYYKFVCGCDSTN